MVGSFRKANNDWFFIPEYLLARFDDVVSDVKCCANPSVEPSNKYPSSALDTYVEEFNKYRIDKVVVDLPVLTVL